MRVEVDFVGIGAEAAGGFVELDFGFTEGFEDLVEGGVELGKVFEVAEGGGEADEGGLFVVAEGFEGGKGGATEFFGVLEAGEAGFEVVRFAGGGGGGGDFVDLEGEHVDPLFALALAVADGGEFAAEGFD